MRYSACVWAVLLVMVLCVRPTAAVQRGANAATSGKPAAVVQMTGDAVTFNPERIEIRRGQTVEWDNNARVIHTVTADPKQAANKKDVSMPPRAKPFDSGFMKPGQTFKHRFTVPGTYRYVCLTHEVQGMVGEVIVK